MGEGADTALTKATLWVPGAGTIGCTWESGQLDTRVSPWVHLGYLQKTWGSSGVH